MPQSKRESCGQVGEIDGTGCTSGQTDQLNLEVADLRRSKL